MSLVRFTSSRSIEDGQAMFKQRIEDCIEIFQKYKNQLVTRPCPVCESNDYVVKAKFHNTFDIVNCDTCSSEYINPCPPTKALGDYYSNFSSNLQNIEMWKKRDKNTKSTHIHDHRVLKLIELGLKDKELSLLEIGCGSGHFLRKVLDIANPNSSIIGVDLDQNAVKFACENGVNAVHGNIEEMSSDFESNFDIIMNFELIEHLIWPKQFLESCYHLLKKDGYLIFTTPNGNGLDNIALGANFKGRMMAHALFPPMHLNNFSSSNIMHLLLSSGYKLKEVTTPGNLDVDMINSHREFDNIDTCFDILNELPEEQQFKLQELIKKISASGHMLIVAQK